MIRPLTIAAALVVLAALPVRAEPTIGAPAPAFSGVDTKGKTVALEDYKGSIVVLEWTNHQCPYVQKHYGSGNMQSLQKDAAAQKVVWLTIISSAPNTQGHVSAAEADKLTQSRNATPAHVVLDGDGKIGRAYEAKTTPDMAVIDKTGTLVYLGAIDDKPTTNLADIPKARNYVRLALADVMSGKPVATAQTTSYGCSIKYSG